MGQRGADPLRHDLGGLRRGVPEVDDADEQRLAGEIGQLPEVELGLRRLHRDLLGAAIGQLSQELIAVAVLGADDGRVAEAHVHGGRRRQAGEGGVDGRHRDPAGRLGVVAQPRLVELDDVGARRLERAGLLVDGGGEVHDELVELVVGLVRGLLGHRERAGQGDLDRAIRVGAQELDVADLDGSAPAHRADDARHHSVTGAGRDGGGMLGVDPVQRRGEAVGVALAPHLPIGDGVDPRALHVADGQPRGVVLGLLQEGLGDPPGRGHAHAWHGVRSQGVAVDEPARLGIAADDAGGQAGHRRDDTRRRPAGRRSVVVSAWRAAISAARVRR